MAGRKRGKSQSPFHPSEFDTGLVQAATQPSVNGQAKSDRRCIVAGDWEYFLFLVASGHSVRLLSIPGCPISGWEGSAPLRDIACRLAITRIVTNAMS